MVEGGGGVTESRGGRPGLLVLNNLYFVKQHMRRSGGIGVLWPSCLSVCLSVSLLYPRKIVFIRSFIPSPSL